MDKTLRKKFDLVCDIINKRENEKQLIVSTDVTPIIISLYHKYNNLVSFNKIYMSKNIIYSILKFE